MFNDTFHFLGLTEKKVLISLTASWGSPLEQRIKAYFSDLIWEYDMEYISQSYPRDCFDPNGLFKKPKTFKESSIHNGISSSISSFVEKVLSNQRYEYEFNNAGSTFDLLFKKIT